jgi:hypothetical protein
MKSNRSVGHVDPGKSSLRIPVSTLTTDHLSALEAFERWQRESPRAGAVITEERTTEPDQPLRN